MRNGDAMPSGKILRAIDHGSMWQLVYETDQKDKGVVYFDHRPFAHFYEGATGRSFFHDYRFGAGREYVSQALRDIRISVEGEDFNESVRLLDGVDET